MNKYCFYVEWVSENYPIQYLFAYAKLLPYCNFVNIIKDFKIKISHIIYLINENQQIYF